ncbi:MAG: TlpA disulfide reductase family protein, partial [Planctomycetota bacterium]
MRRLFALVALLSVCAQVALTQQRSILGTVVDSEGKAVAHASVATLWRANGNMKKPDGTPFDLQDEAQLREYWGRLGQMEPINATETRGDGTFSASISWRDRALFAMNAERTHGCICEIPESSDDVSPLVMRLTRLVTVTGEFQTSVKGDAVDWTHSYVELPADVTRPLANNRMISCGSFDRRFEVRLPPGAYRLDAYGVSDSAADIIDLRVHPAPRFSVKGSTAKLDIGKLDLSTAPPSRAVLEGEAKKTNRWRDFTEHYGEVAPDWHSVDGRGIDHQRNLNSLQGKWVLLDFWGMSCAPCLGRNLPKMMEFYERNSNDREKFEIIGICIDFSGEIGSMSQLDRALLPIETNVWNGKKIPFPIVLDNTLKTWERYGIPGLG